MNLALAFENHLKFSNLMSIKIKCIKTTKIIPYPRQKLNKRLKTDFVLSSNGRDKKRVKLNKTV